MKRRVLITGAAGFLGGHFSRYLREWAGDVYVIATDVAAGDSTAADEFVRTDLAVANAAAELVRTTRPDCIVHLAGVFGAGDALELYRVNVLPLTGLLDAVVRECPGAALITAGSAAEYGRIEASRLPATEDHPCEPVTAYGQSKLCATHLALYYHRVHGLAATVVRPFQLLGKGVTPRLAPGAFYEQLRAATAAVSASSGATAVVRVGNLESQR
ncbi:MAG: NAD(P)-dependent oxidoreductase, partial [Planctomycetota bacterium]